MLETSVRVTHTHILASVLALDCRLGSTPKASHKGSMPVVTVHASPPKWVCWPTKLPSLGHQITKLGDHLVVRHRIYRIYTTWKYKTPLSNGANVANDPNIH
jgi:hypothetical protein